MVVYVISMDGHPRRWEDLRGRTRDISQPIAWAELPEPYKEVQNG